MSLCYMDRDSFAVCIKTEVIYESIVNNVETRFDTSNFELDRQLSKGKNKKVIGLVKDELGGKIMIAFHALRPNTYSYLTDENEEEIKK